MHEKKIMKIKGLDTRYLFINRNFTEAPWHTPSHKIAETGECVVKHSNGGETKVTTINKETGKLQCPLPTEFDKKVFYLLIHKHKVEKGNLVLKFNSYYDLITQLKILPTKQNYERVKLSLLKYTLTTVHHNNTFYIGKDDDDNPLHVSGEFRLINKYEEKVLSETGEKGVFVWLNEQTMHFLFNQNSNYKWEIHFETLCALNGLELRLYELIIPATYKENTHTILLHTLVTKLGIKKHKQNKKDIIKAIEGINEKLVFEEVRENRKKKTRGFSIQVEFIKEKAVFTQVERKMKNNFIKMLNKKFEEDMRNSL